MAYKPIKDFRGGLSKRDSRELKDNQFEVLRNFNYDKDQRLRTRRGVRQYFADVPDNVVLINNCNATAGFAVSDDAVGLAVGTAIRGTGSVSFNITVATVPANQATLTHATLVANITTAKGYLGFWIKPPAGFNTGLTAVTVKIGSDAANYYQWTLGTLTENSNNFVKLAYTDATVTGAPNDAAITYFQLQITYTGAYTDKVGVLIDDIQSYSQLSLKPVTSYFFFQRDDTQERIAICTSGQRMFHWNEVANAWDQIESGLSEFEVQTGMTTNRTRWSFDVYKNVIYMCNGVDFYRSWNGVAITTYPAQPKVRYLKYMGDRFFGFGEDANPSTLYYTNALAADASVLNANLVVVGGDELGRGNGLFDLGKFILAGKTKKIYVVDVTNGSIDGIDTQNGWYSQRVIRNVENAILYLNDAGIDNLAQKQAATGADALASELYTADLGFYTQQIAPRQLNANCGFYIKPVTNYYFSFDTGDDNLPDTTLVLSTRVPKAWSEYTLPSGYDYGYYIDANGTYHYVLASAVAGFIYEIEYGFDDLGGVIDYELLTKAWDFGDPSIWKDFKCVDINGLKSEGNPIEVEVLVDGEVVISGTIDDSFLNISGGPASIATASIGSEPIGGGPVVVGGEPIELFPYKFRLGGDIFAAGEEIQVRMYSNTTPIVWTLEEMKLRFDTNTVDIYPFDNIG